MYIGKLNKQEIKEIFKMLVSIVEHDIDNVNYYLENCKIEKSKDSINIIFYVGYEAREHHCFITDFNASVSFGHITDDEKVKVAYRKYMYQMFGNEYYNDMRDYYKRIIFSKCDKQLEELSNELNEMIK